MNDAATSGPEALEAPTETIEVKAPPNAIIPQDTTSTLAMVLPLTGSMGVMVFMAVSNSSNTRMMFMGGGMVVAMLSMVAANIYRQVRQHRNNVANQRREYLAYLSEVRDTVRSTAALQRRRALSLLPDPEALPFLAHQGVRVWERARSGSDPLRVRVGRSTQPLAARLEAEELGALASPDPVCESAMRRFLDTHTDVDALPLSTSLSGISHLELAGAGETTRAQVRALLAHLMTLTPPSMLRVVVVAAQEHLPEWEWVKWAPHAWSDRVEDAVGPARLVATSLEALAGRLPEVLERHGLSSWKHQEQDHQDADGVHPHVLVVVDGSRIPPSLSLAAQPDLPGVTVVELVDIPSHTVSRTRLRLVLSPGAAGADEPVAQLLAAGQDPVPVVTDLLSAQGAEVVARRLAARFSTAGEEVVAAPVGTSDPARSADLMELLGLGDVRDFDPQQRWARRTGDQRLNIPFGVTPEGEPVSLDIKESAEGGMGPHGLLVGATGSGKSEVLRTLVLALSLTHSPEQLNFVLVDFKGGATFAGMSELPHVSAMISNLESELDLVDRMEEALRGEMVRRQEILRDTGNYANVSDYEEARRAGRHDGPVLPALLVILDEFSELLSARSELIDSFVAIGRLGRSLQVHLLMSSQRLDEGRLHGLDSHLSYRIGLRTFSAMESRVVLGVTDAYELPSLPGSGFLKSDNQTMTRFRAAYVAGRPPARSSPQSHRGEEISVAPRPTGPVEVLPFTAVETVRAVEAAAAGTVPASPGAATSPPPPPPPPPPSATPPVMSPAPVPDPAAADSNDSYDDLHEDDPYADMSMLDIAVSRMVGHGTPAHQIWLPPLDVSETLDSLTGDLVADATLGLVSPSWRSRGDLVLPLGVTDIPLEQRREHLTVDLSGAGGHVAVVGAPLTGKSTTLRSLLMGLALTRTPAEVQLYVIDMGGGTFATMQDLPHLAGMATRDDPDVVNRIMAEISSLLDDRERYFRANRVDSIQTYRHQRAAGNLDDGYGDVFLVVDGWGTLRADFEDVAAQMMSLASRALALGVHFVLSSVRWMDVRPQIRDLIGTRIELRMGDAADSEHGRKVARAVPRGRPGRGLDAQGHHMLVALPRIDGDHDPATLAQGVERACRAVASAWKGAPGPKLRLLPTRVELATLRERVPARSGPVIGLDEARLAPVELDMRKDPSLIVLGDAKTGKSSFLRALAAELSRCYRPDQARLIVLDLRRSLLGEVSEEHMLVYLTTRDAAAEEFRSLHDYLQRRLPGPQVTPEQLRTRSWWEGPEIYLLVDDYDLVVTGQANPLLVLQPLLAQAQDIGLHLVLTRRIGGATRGMFEPVMQTLTDLSTPGIMLPGNPEEGPLLGRQKPVPGPPGRARLITRDEGVRVLQLAWAPPSLYGR
ncbi:type VII secretion protein EccCa [Actinomyces wuliandei]|uniref:type VII secretion protein EccCa n=1 Tax=Actinomyces wuliandei TaxID=2057743 RepID=UPI000FDCB0BC|nr:type VII secretion protein EccCa [Actinomyces wuliandei]